MSSHHIVRDNQEPALILLDGESLIYSIVQDFLEWSPAIIVNESLVDEVLQWGIKIDTVLCDSKNLNAIEEKMKDQIPVKIVVSNENNAVETILRFLQQGNYSSVNIFSEHIGLFSTLEEMGSKINIALIQNKKRWSLIRSSKFEKWVGSGVELILRKNNAEKTIRSDNQNRISVHETGPYWIGEDL
jgi:thiamine pyrophosphokinase